MNSYSGSGKQSVFGVKRKNLTKIQKKLIFLIKKKKKYICTTNHIKVEELHQ